ncbi:MULTISPECIES: hypothetical protein [Agrobacterium]|uniref:Uncharacterized protein n=1 Tax=Agrobacterium larrymoorei TaxID=160699 RepID=A0ABX8TC66_9HYPH|nr:hypothetical protein [Agrobacterium larrymoorei]NSZ10050.1 hypothetical protein [Agrobacterium tumefaciens]QYA10852.1 hypothetical protein J5285_25845 [Agrobacterium larrymoorei]
MRKPVLFKGMLAGVAMLAGGAFMSTSAHADDWACEVALCISNPNGPMAVSQCVPPIKKLYRHLAKGRSFPMCKSADGHVNFTRVGMEMQEDCPTGTTTVYRDNENGGFLGRNTRMCQKFVPMKNQGGLFLGDRDDRKYEWRMVDGKRVYGEVVTTQAARREKPRYLDYVVQGDSRRLWW